jgi:hypothetical protein
VGVRESVCFREGEGGGGGERERERARDTEGKREGESDREKADRGAPERGAHPGPLPSDLGYQKDPFWYRCRAKSSYTIHSRPDYGPGFGHFPANVFDTIDRLRVLRGEKMALRGTDLESYITEYT